MAIFFEELGKHLRNVSFMSVPSNDSNRNNSQINSNHSSVFSANLCNQKKKKALNAHLRVDEILAIIVHFIVNLNISILKVKLFEYKLV